MGLMGKPNIFLGFDDRLPGNSANISLSLIIIYSYFWVLVELVVSLFYYNLSNIKNTINNYSLITITIEKYKYLKIIMFLYNSREKK